MGELIAGQIIPMGELIAGQITAMVITYNEGPNLGRCLSGLRWAPRILVVDSGSTDETLDIARQHPRVDLVERPFDDFAAQCNFGLAQIKTGWVLSLDADYQLSEALVAEILALREDDAAGYSAAFIYRIYGRPLRGSLYPPRVVLYRREGAAYRNEGHAHRIAVAGRVGTLHSKILLDDRKPISRWFASQRHYAEREADYLLGTPRADLGWADRVRLMGWPAPIFVFLYTLIVKRCALDGWAGWLYVLQRTFAEIALALEIVDRRLRREDRPESVRTVDGVPPRRSRERANAS
jgi:glycosyltransferase involved in cell wall biosynthesis